MKLLQHLDATLTEHAITKEGTNIITKWNDLIASCIDALFVLCEAPGNNASYFLYQ